MKRFFSLILITALVFSTFHSGCFANFNTKTAADRESEASSYAIGDDIAGAYLVEASTGKVLFAKNEYQSMIPASVTKIMTLLLVCEAIDSRIIALDDTVTVSQNAASKGGSQIFLKEGERMSVLDLLKSTIIASANDAAVALAELVAGSESAFVRRMNKRAAELGLKNTVFENATGLDDTATNHYSCPADIAKMSIELIKHSIILEYSSLWQDSIRNGEFTLTNTNRLVRYYDGCNGLKTGSTDKAGYCVSASA
jgi:D-alanyl-D-alanine carboxypeptidase (penicillin-binding protein 5/6)